ncbi:MAG: zf-HC2 domain-containing protein [Bacteroidales bacterium]
MKCIDEELLQRFHDGECQDETGRRVQLHVSTCPDCRLRYEQLQSRVKTIKMAFEKMCPQAMEIPPLVLSEPLKKHISFHRKYLFPLLAAASLLLFIIVFNKKEANNLPVDPMLHNSFVSEMDANKPAHQQELSFTVISPDGVVSEHFVRPD